MSEKFSAGDQLTADDANQMWRGGSSVEGLNAGETINGATLPVACYQSTSDNEIYACDANDTTKLEFVGFAISNGTDGASIDMQFDGIVNGFTGLDEGEMYFVQDDKTIGKTPGTLAIQVGYAIDATEILIVKGSLYNRGSASRAHASGTGTQNVAHGLGVIPKLFKITSVGDTSSNTTNTIGIGSATSTSNQSVIYMTPSNNVFGSDVSNVIYTKSSAGADGWIAAVSAIDKTNVTLNFTTASAGETIYFSWEAYA